MTSPAGGFGLADDPVVQAKNKIMETGTEVSKQARELANILETCSAGWTGVGAAGFKKAQVLLNEDHDTIRRLLNVLLNAVGETKNLSNANDDEVRASFAAANSALNNV
ncbi:MULTISPECIES: hypothetical protein [Streptomyces]|uniref:WXG100 family type VII secretion target n=1 Tax=Streptomyces marianii TaxID=1817406 RepID=A0A5R9E2Z6_9ACTN|nr:MULTISPECIES: hypothetical protein [Streptomyces]MDI9888747.1 hypothetical protein [Streptomyces sp. HNM0645]TLQ43359.1 hypothetical protein FEF34_09600 [Streptomyces marianii]